MTTIPARLAQRTVVSANLAEAQARSRALYRDFYRSAPEICALYALDVPPSTMRAKIRTKFEASRNVRDVAVLDIMLHKGRVDYQETMNAWKQIPHIMKWFAEEEAPREFRRMTPKGAPVRGRQLSVVLTALRPRISAQPETFLEKFYASRDEGRGNVLHT